MLGFGFGPAFDVLGFWRRRRPSLEDSAVVVTRDSLHKDRDDLGGARVRFGRFEQQSAQEHLASRVACLFVLGGAGLKGLQPRGLLLDFLPDARDCLGSRDALDSFGPFGRHRLSS